MTDVTVRQFAEVVGLPVERLMAQLAEAGLKISDADDTISDMEKMQLLRYLRKSHGKAEQVSVSQPNKLTLKRKSHTEFDQPQEESKSHTEFDQPQEEIWLEEIGRLIELWPSKTSYGLTPAQKRKLGVSTKHIRLKLIKIAKDRLSTEYECGRFKDALELSSITTLAWMILTMWKCDPKQHSGSKERGCQLLEGIFGHILRKSNFGHKSNKPSYAGNYGSGDYGYSSDKYICPVCNGDGGIGGHCYKCGGSGGGKKKLNRCMYTNKNMQV